MNTLKQYFRKKYKWIKEIKVNQNIAARHKQICKNTCSETSQIGNHGGCRKQGP
jgi:hypothetical protein